MHNLQVCKLISVAPGSKDELLVFSLQPKLPRICATIGNLTWINAILPGKTKEQMKTMVPAGSQETDALTRDGQLALSALLAARGVSTHVCITIDDCSSKPNARRRERRAKHARVRVEPLWTWAEPASRLSKVTTVTDWQPASEPACKTVGWCQLASSTSLASIGDAELKKKKKHGIISLTQQWAQVLQPRQNILLWVQNFLCRFLDVSMAPSSEHSAVKYNRGSRSPVLLP